MLIGTSFTIGHIGGLGAGGSVRFMGLDTGVKMSKEGIKERKK